MAQRADALRRSGVIGMAEKRQDTFRLQDREGNTLAYKVRERGRATARRGPRAPWGGAVVSDDVVAVVRPVAVLVVLVASIILLLV